MSGGSSCVTTLLRAHDVLGKEGGMLRFAVCCLITIMPEAETSFCRSGVLLIRMDACSGHSRVNGMLSLTA